MREPKAAVAIVGAGVVGCAVAHELASRGLKPLVLESATRSGEATTSRNSGVIHAGLFYSRGSAKESLCVRGNALLYEWCRTRGVPHRKTGKWIVGSADQEPNLEALRENAIRRGIGGVIPVPPSALSVRLPGVRADLALLSANTGIVDAVAFCRSLQAAAEEGGAQFVFHSAVTAIARSGRGYRLETSRGPLDAELVVNAAGLYADEIARLVGVERYRIYPCRGDYFALTAGAALAELIYPVAPKGQLGLGVHLTPALDGSLRLGPDARYVDSKEALGEPANIEALRSAFLEAAQRYLPALRPDQLRYGGCGLRPKLRGPEESEEQDFVIAQDLPGFVNLVGIDSPGLTAALAIAERVGSLLLG